MSDHKNKTEFETNRQEQKRVDQVATKVKVGDLDRSDLRFFHRDKKYLGEEQLEQILASIHHEGLQVPDRVLPRWRPQGAGEGPPARRGLPPAGPQGHARASRWRTRSTPSRSGRATPRICWSAASRTTPSGGAWTRLIGSAPLGRSTRRTCPRSRAAVALGVSLNRTGEIYSLPETAGCSITSSGTTSTPLLRPRSSKRLRTPSNSSKACRLP